MTAANLAHIWFPHLVHAFWQNTAAALLVLLGSRFLPRNPRLRHGLLLLGIVKFALPPMLPAPTGLFSAAPPAGEIAMTATVVRFSYRLEAVLVVLMCIHAAGTFVALIRIASAWWKLETIRRHAPALDRGIASSAGLTRLAAALLVSREITTPLTLGVFRRAIILPTAVAGMPAEALRAIIGHELEHVRRRDTAWNLLHSVIGAVWWFHPLYHRLDAEARAAREECCDDAVIAGGWSTVACYAEVLARTAGLMPARSLLVGAHMAGGRHRLVGRVERLANPAFAPSRRIGASGLLVIAIAAAAILPGLRVSRDNHLAFDRATLRALHLVPKQNHNH